VRGRVDHKEAGETKLVAQEVEPFEPSPEEVERAEAEAAVAAVPVRLTLHVSPGVGEDFLDELKSVVDVFPGKHELLLAVGQRRLVLGDGYRVSADSACRAALGELQGAARIVA
jgi:hypothetical protein